MEKHFYKTYSFYLALLPIIILLLPKLTALVVLLFIPILIIGLKNKQLIFQFNWLNFSFVLLYLIYLFYCLFTRHSDIASKYLEYKLSFVIFPFIFSFRTKEKPNFKWILASFVTSSLLLSILSFVHSYSCFQISKEIGCWITASFSYLHHPSYASVYFTVAIFSVWYMWKNRMFCFPLTLAIVLTLIFTGSIFLCLSLAGMLFLMGSTTIFLLIKICQKWGMKYFLATVIVLPIGLFSVITLEPHVKGEFQQALDEAVLYAQSPNEFIQNQTNSGSDERLIMWTISVQAIKKYPMGVGTGNVDEVLTNRLQKIGQNDLALKLYNPHNQYLQTWLEVGIFGLITLLFIGFYALKIGLRFRNYLLLLVATNMLFNMLFESMLQRQSGIVFYTFSLCLMMAYHGFFVQKREF